MAINPRTALTGGFGNLRDAGGVRASDRLAGIPISRAPTPAVRTPTPVVTARPKVTPTTQTPLPPAAAPAPAPAPKSAAATPVVQRNTVNNLNSLFTGAGGNLRDAGGVKASDRLAGIPISRAPVTNTRPPVSRRPVKKPPAKTATTTTTDPATTTTTPTTPTTPVYDAKNPPPGFTGAQWQKLVTLSKTNPQVAELVTKYTSSIGKPNPDDAWRRVMPTNNSQLLKQLSYNAGEMGMPGGYVGAIQLPAYGSTQAPVNNPDMTKYGQAPGIGEATFYQQSMNGGMTPIASMSPLGVPQGWNPGGTSTEDQLNAYLTKLGTDGGGGGGGGGGNNKSTGPADVFERNMRAGRGSQLSMIATLLNGRRKNATTDKTPAATYTPPVNAGTGTTTGTDSTPISLPFGF
jgi:hypothetical protein